MKNVTVVECKECRHCKKRISQNNVMEWACYIWLQRTIPEGYCHKGKTKTKEE